MNLKELIFTDGQVVSYEHAGDRLTVNFRDYADDLVYIYFFGVTSFQDCDCLGFSLAGHNLNQHAGRQYLELFDDESIVVFLVEFESATYQVEENF